MGLNGTTGVGGAGIAPDHENPRYEGIARTDYARTFAETDVTLTHTETQVTNEKLELTTTHAGTSVGVGGALDNSTWNEVGVKVSPNTPLQGITVTIDPDSEGANYHRVQRLSDSTVIWSENVARAAGETFTITVDLLATEEYAVYAVPTDQKRGYASGTATFPVESADIDCTGGWLAGSHGQAHWWSNIEAVPYTLSGSCYVEWPLPNDVLAWDVVSKKAATDGETVDVYVEEDQAGGWTEIAGPIAPGEKIDQADPSNNVRFRVEISRTDYTNNPTVDTLVRRYKVAET